MRVKMATKSAFFLLLLVIFFAVVVTVSSYEDQRGRKGREQEQERGRPEWERESEGGREWGRQGEGDMGGRGKKGREQEEERGRPEWEREQEGGREWGRQEEGDMGGRGKKGREQEGEWGGQEEGDMGGRGKKGREQEQERGRPEWEREQEGGKEWERESEGERREWGRQGEGDMGGRGKKGREQEEGREREQEGERGRREWEREQGRGGDEGDLFLLHDSEHVVRTDAGDMKVVKGYGGKFTQNKMHIGFITMEPNSLFIPQYIDANLILFVSIGEAKLGYIYEDELAEKQLKKGDVYRIPAGSAFYLVNTAEGQRLHIICSIDTSDSVGWHTFQSFFIGGGTNPTSVLAGFDPLTISTAFNVSMEELKGIMTRQRGGPIVYLSDGHAPSVWTKFLDSNKEQRLSQLKSIVHSERRTTRDEEYDQSKWSSWRKLLKPLFGEENKKKAKGTSSTGPDSYNLYDRNPDFKNDYGWSMALDEEDYSPLTHSGVGVYLVNLTAGSMMAPHVNPTATEYGIVLRGSGTIQIVHPNGSLAMKAEVNQGDVFWVPRYFPFCQIASRTGPFEFFGFTTSALKNRPQFLVGANSLLQTMMGPELAAAFGVSEERLRNVTTAQRESVILPSASALPPRREKEEEPGEEAPRRGKEEEEAGEEAPRQEKEEETGKEMPKVIKSLANEMVMGFD